MIGRVKSCEKSKSGKSWRVNIDGTYYGAAFDTHLETAIGKQINFTHKTTDFGPWIESWAFDQSTASATEPAPARNGDRWWLPFVSNQVAHAIAAGKITDPADMGKWAKAAKETIQAIDAL